MYLPLNNVEGRKHYFRIPVDKICFFTVSLPLFAFIVCVLMTMIKDFEHANNTHCKVPNIFPSISASIGNYEPQNTIWKTAIYIHSPIRFYIITLRFKQYIKTIKRDYWFAVNVAVLLNIVENLSLIGLTHWNSNRYYPYHEFCFKTFIATSLFYMLFVCLLLTKCRQKQIVPSRESCSLKIKWRSFLINVGSFALAAFFFLRHNDLCEPYVYSMFSFSEYIVVTSNITFHLTTVYDLTMQYIFLTNKGIIIE